jgi:cystathionine gamma-lyase
MANFSQISLSTTFAQSGVGKPVGAYEYTRSANPNRSVLKTLMSLPNTDMSQG